MSNFFVPTPRPARFGADGRPWPTCPCGEYQSTTPDWHGWRACPCSAAIGEITSVGSPRWQIHDADLVERQRLERQERHETALAERMAEERRAQHDRGGRR